MRETASVGVGIHFVQLLVLGSLMGDFSLEKLHPKIINDLCKNIIKEILVYAPRGITPGNYVELRNFDCFTGKLGSITLDENHSKTESFLRPFDLQFAETGYMATCRNFENFAAEDILHMGPRCEFARRLGCKVNELPCDVDVTYYPRPKKAYSIYNPTTGSTGYFIFDGKKIDLDYEESGEEIDNMTSTRLSVLSWHEELAEKGFVMVPMVWRSGACVCYGEGVGCLVPPDEHEQITNDGNFCIGTISYRALVGVGEKVELRVMKTLETLLPIGQRLYLKFESPSGAQLLRRLPGYISRSDANNYVLQVHLASPNTVSPVPGKVYVAFVASMMGGGEVRSSSCEIMVVDPWELLLDYGEKEICKFVSI